MKRHRFFWRHLGAACIAALVILGGMEFIVWMGAAAILVFTVRQARFLGG